MQHVVINRLALFSGFDDLSSSFMFNLLSNAASIKNIAEYISTNQTAKKYDVMAGNIA
jgi:hypothetical protein